VQERLAGPEYTVNMYIDRRGRLLAAIPHLRLEVRDGEVSKGRTERQEDLLSAAEKISLAFSRIGAFGPLCFQAIVTPEGPSVFEINARFGGGFPLTHKAGGRFTSWVLEEALGREPAPERNWREGLLMLRYDGAVFSRR
jgi:carbamoyl-phosphate synthase large subunit